MLRHADEQYLHITFFPFCFLLGTPPGHICIYLGIFVICFTDHGLRFFFRFVCLVLPFFMDYLCVDTDQRFEASEVGMLARCLCAPLVSIRVGKVNKQGNLLCPTATR